MLRPSLTCRTRPFWRGFSTNIDADVPRFLWRDDAAPSSGFGLQNLPYGALIMPGQGGTKSAKEQRACTRIGDWVVDLEELADRNLLPQLLKCGGRLNDFFDSGKAIWQETRTELQTLFGENSARSLQQRGQSLSGLLHPVEKVKLVLPFSVGGFTDFYASPFHARVNQFPAWWHQPLGYNSRASSVVVSGQPVYRPFGQFISGRGQPIQGLSKAVDFELEVGVVVGKGNDHGKRVVLEDADDSIFGYMLLNDWSARDIQGWEMEPLGPFLGKSFCSTVSPWVVSAEALKPFRIAGAKQDPRPLQYLRHDGPAPTYNIDLEVHLQPEGEVGEVVCRSNFRHVYWSPAQLIAHHTSNGCPLRPGDILGTGTVSGPEDFARGCMAEWRRTGQKLGPRGFLLDGDTVTMRGLCQSPDVPFTISFGECTGTLRPMAA